MPKRRAPPNTHWRGPTLWAKVIIAGHTYRQSLRTDDPALARRRVEEFRRELTGRAHFGEANRSFDEVMAAWGQGLTDRVAPKTAKRYRCSLGQLEPFLAGKALAEVDAALIGTIAEVRRKSGTTVATIKRDLVALSSVIGYAVEEGWAESNPVLARLGRLKERRDPIVLPSIPDIERVVAAATPSLARLITAAWRTGCRQDELVKARRGDLDVTRRQLTIIGKRNKRRTIDLTAEAVEALAASDGDLLFPSPTDGKLRNPASSFSRLAKRLAATGEVARWFRFHDLRHRFAVDYLKAGGSLYLLQQHLGHSGVKTTEIYLAHLSPAEQLAAKFGTQSYTKSYTEAQTRGAEKAE